MQCCVCSPKLTGEQVRVKFVGDNPTWLNLASTPQCTEEAVLEEVIDTVMVGGITSDIHAFHCTEHVIKQVKPPPIKEPT